VVTAQELQKLVRDEFNEMWMPRQVDFLAELPLTSAHKIDKVALRSGHAAARDAAR
jgi:acyl-coenzyme A synthetase/AMP-(fatty) acid ligase